MESEFDYIMMLFLEIKRLEGFLSGGEITDSILFKCRYQKRSGGVDSSHK